VLRRGTTRPRDVADAPGTAEAELRAFDTAVSLGDYLRVVTRRKWAVFIIFITTVMLAALVSLRMPKVYQTSATIKISQRISGQNILTQFYFDPYFLETEIEMIRSRALVLKVANRLRSTYTVPSASAGLADAFELEVADGAPMGPLNVTFTSATTYEVTFGKAPPLAGKVGERVDGDFGTLLVTAENARKGDFINIQIASIDGVVGGIMASLQVRPVENVNMVRVTVSGRDPERVAKLANAVCDIYVESSLTEKRLQATSTRMFIEDQIERTAANLREAETALEDFKRKTGIVDMTAESRHYVDVVATLETDLMEASIDRQINAGELAMMRRRAESRPGSANAFPTDKIIMSRFAAGSALAALENRLLELQKKRADLLISRRPDHPSVKALDAEISAANGELDRAIGEAFDSGDLATKVAIDDEKTRALEENIRHYRDIASGLPEKEMELNRLLRAYQVNEQVYTMLLEKLQEAKINEAMENADIRVVDYAFVPKAPISPNYMKNIMVGVLLGIFLGVGVAYALEFSDTSMNSVEEVERRLSRPVIGIVPRIGIGPVEKIVTRPGRYDSYFISHAFPKSPVAEAYRTLRTAILASGVDIDIKKILITSTGLSDGKTSTSVNLAITFAQVGNATVLVDCDLRRSMVHRAFNLARAPGLADVIMGRAELSEAVRATDVANLWLVPSGVVPPNPSELLGSKKFEKIIAELSKKYDRIILDAPPVLAVTDALVLSRLTDGTCFVVCAGRTDRNAARRSLYLLDRTGSRILGIVLNQVDVQRVYGTYGYKYYHQYYKAYIDGEGDT